MINQQYEDDCNRRGKCIGGKCHCYRKWRGINCAIPRKMCPKKCLNGGTCTDRGRYGSHQMFSDRTLGMAFYPKFYDATVKEFVYALTDILAKIVV